MFALLQKNLILLFCNLIAITGYNQTAILTSVRNSLRAPRTAALQTWTGNASEPCSWTGIVCNSQGSVTEINLQNQSLRGPFPVAVAAIRGLRVLNLNDNPLDSRRIPTSLFALTKLRRLHLSNCSLTGNIPRALGSLRELRVLELSCNLLTGEIPPEIGALKKLCQLQLYNNSLSGNLPSGFANLTSLEYLDASTNDLSGNLTVLSGLTQLVSLHLYQNRFAGAVPDEFALFPMLRELSLYMNGLSGPLPKNLGKFSDLEVLDVSENALQGQLPPDICANGKLRYFLALQNSFDGSIPEPYGACQSLLRFRVNNNRLRGNVPRELWGLPHAAIIDLSHNSLEGPLGADIALAENLSFLFLQNNRFSGSLPPELGQARSLNKFDASNNLFSGTLPIEIGNLRSLTSLQLQRNNLSGDLPQSLEHCTALSELNLAQNALRGSLPVSWGSLTALNSLNLSNNYVSGSIPESFSALQLCRLDLSNNQLTGLVPRQLLVAQNKHSFAGNPALCSADGPSDSLPVCSSPASGQAEPHLVILVLSLLCFLLTIIVLATFLLRRSPQGTPINADDQRPWNLKSYYKLDLTAEDILNFLKDENLLATGGSSNVYRGELGTGEAIAIKRLSISDSEKDKNGVREFKTEVETLSLLKHKNIVRLYCSVSDGHSHLLVYEYMQNGSLWELLHRQNHIVMDWPTRYRIAVGIANALSYLHHDCAPAVVHGDVTSANILINSDFEPALADFGLAKLVHAAADSETFSGTFGYIPPESAYAKKVSEKSDVYGFGIVLMELVTGRKPTDSAFGEMGNIVRWVACKISSAGDDIVGEVMDGRMLCRSEVFAEEMVKVLKVAVLCCSPMPRRRPSMRQVAQLLHHLHLQVDAQKP